MVGLLYKGKPVLGGIALPFFREIYIGGKNLPTTKNGVPVTGSDKIKLLDCLVAYGIDADQSDPARTYQEMQLVGAIGLGCRNLRTSNSVYDTAKMLDGGYGVSVNQGSKIWDNVAQQAITEGAGLLYTDINGEPIDYSAPLTRVDQNFTFCAGPPALHAQAQALINGRAV